MAVVFIGAIMFLGELGGEDDLVVAAEDLAEGMVHAPGGAEGNSNGPAAGWRLSRERSPPADR